jgi:hypothetical protein
MGKLHFDFSPRVFLIFSIPVLYSECLCDAKVLK